MTKDNLDSGDVHGVLIWGGTDGFDTSEGDYYRSYFLSLVGGYRPVTWTLQEVAFPDLKSLILLYLFVFHILYLAVLKYRPSMLLPEENKGQSLRVMIVPRYYVITSC